MKKESEHRFRRTGKTVSVFLAFLLIIGLAGAAAEDGQALPDEVQAALEQAAAEEPVDDSVPAEAPASPEAALLPETSGTPAASPAEQGTSAAAEQEETEEAGGVLRIGSPYRTALGAPQKLRLNVPSKMDLLLQAGGVPVKVRIINVKNGWQKSLRTPDTGDADRIETAAQITLSRGEYLVVLEPVRTGRVSVCFAQASRPEGTTDQITGPAAGGRKKGKNVPQTEGTDAGTAQEQAEEPSGSSAPAADDAGKAGGDAETGEPSGATDAADINAGENPPAEESALPEDAEKAGEPSAPDEEAGPQPLTVSVIASCEGPYEPGALITLRALVSDENYQGIIRWQYSADGGLTVCDVDDAEGPEYSFFLDEINSTWWWRAFLQ